MTYISWSSYFTLTGKSSDERMLFSQMTRECEQTFDLYDLYFMVQLFYLNSGSHLMNECYSCRWPVNVSRLLTCMTYISWSSYSTLTLADHLMKECYSFRWLDNVCRLLTCMTYISWSSNLVLQGYWMVEQMSGCDVFIWLKDKHFNVDLLTQWFQVSDSCNLGQLVFQGHSPAGGCLLAMCCDYRIMAPNFTIGLNETQLVSLNIIMFDFK